MTFVKAVKHESKLRLAVAGPSGSGKTYTSLAIAASLGGSVAVVDTEHGSASKYADLFDFDVKVLAAPFHPDRYVAAIREAAQAGYNVIVLDSLTHAWNGTGGLLDIVEEFAKRMKSSNTFAAWKDATPIQNRLTEGIVGAPIHVIATMRSKQDYVQDTDANGRARIRKVGMAPVQREGFEYEFDVFLDMDIENNAIVTKTRCPALTGRVFNKPSADVAKILADWLHGVPAQSLRAVDTSTGEITESADAIPSRVVEWLNQVKPPEAAKAWAVEIGAQPNDQAAREALKQIVDSQFGGNLTKAKLPQALTVFYLEQQEQLAKAVDAISVENGEALTAF